MRRNEICISQTLQYYLDDKSRAVWDCVHALRLDATGLGYVEYGG